MIGMILPFVGMIIMYFIWGSGTGFGGFLKSLTYEPGLASKVLTLSLLINLVPFVYCNFKRIDLTMRGIVVATMLYAVFIALVKFVW
jgi:hypothetical protein